MRRTKTFNEELSQKLRRPRFARSFIQSLIEGEEGLSPQDALRTTIEIMGIKEFAELVGEPPARIHEFLKKKRSLKPNTLDVFLKPFGLRTRIAFERAS